MYIFCKYCQLPSSKKEWRLLVIGTTTLRHNGFLVFTASLDAGNSDAKAALSEMYDVIAIGIFNYRATEAMAKTRKEFHQKNKYKQYRRDGKHIPDEPPISSVHF